MFYSISSRWRSGASGPFMPVVSSGCLWNGGAGDFATHRHRLPGLDTARPLPGRKAGSAVELPSAEKPDPGRA